MKIAIIGSGISGLTAAYLLQQKYSVTLFESDDTIGGHTATKEVKTAYGNYAVDTGFIVYNDWTYPNFIKLLGQLNVPSQPTSMGFSAFYADGRFEYSGDNINTLFSDRRTLLSPEHWRMLRDIIRFNKEAVRDWQDDKIPPAMTLGEYLQENRYSNAFVQRYLIPMGSAIWSASTGDMEQFPLQFFIKFFHNHGLLSVNHRPTWRVIKGGSKTYLGPLSKSFAGQIRVADPVIQVMRHETGVSVKSSSGEWAFDQVIFACHSDQALKILGDTTADEQKILGAIRYRDNDVVLHTDEALLPKRRRTWSSWNYCLNDAPDQLPILTYNMNILQGISSPQTFCVTLNAADAIAPEKVIGRYRYAHPVFTLDAIAAQKTWELINGSNKTWFCGAYWFNGFHEDGVNSAIRVAAALGVGFP
jgi:predicted NAD/FAD-binding protein